MLTKKPDNLVFLDIETTGLNPFFGAKIIEIAMLKVKGEKSESYETLVNPKCPIPLECSRLHFIYDGMVKDCPSFEEIAKDVSDFIGDDIVVCHNAKFDLSFVNREFKESGILDKKLRYIDTLELARKYFAFDCNALGAIANAIGLEIKTAHRAMADVLTMFSVSKYLFENMYVKGVDEIKPKIYG
jgi:DNA polymerase III epsilon subunit family exonuclease